MLKFVRMPLVVCVCARAARDGPNLMIPFQTQR